MSNISQIQVNNTTYDIKDAVARDEKINKSEIAEPYDSTKEYEVGDIFEIDGKLFQAIKSDSNSARIILGDIVKRIWVGTSEQLSTTLIPLNTFAFTTDDNEKYWTNDIRIYEPFFNSENNRWVVFIDRTVTVVNNDIQYGVILAKNDLTGISNIDDANAMLKIQKVNDNYSVTYANSIMTTWTGTGHYLCKNTNVSKGTSNIAYIRGYSVFINDDNTETIMYTPCKLLSWEET